MFRFLERLRNLFVGLFSPPGDSTNAFAAILQDRSSPVEAKADFVARFHLKGQLLMGMGQLTDEPYGARFRWVPFAMLAEWDREDLDRFNNTRIIPPIPLAVMTYAYREAILEEARTRHSSEDVDILRDYLNSYIEQSRAEHAD